MEDLVTVVTSELVKGVIQAAIGSLIFSVFLRAGAKWVSKIDVPYGTAYVASFIAQVMGLVIGIALGVAIGFTLGEEGMLIILVLAIPIGFLIQAGVVSWKFEVGFGPASLITLIAMALGIVLLLVVGALAFGVMALM